MVSLLAPLLVAAQMQLAIPSTLHGALVAADHAIDCIAQLRSQRLTKAVIDLEERYYALRFEAMKIWDHMREETLDELLALSTPCGSRLAATRVKRATAALDTAERIYQQTILPLWRGAWIGGLKLCRDSVVRTAPGKDVLGQPGFASSSRHRHGPPLRRCQKRSSAGRLPCA